MNRLLDTSICVPLINRSEPDLVDRLLSHKPGSVLLCSVVKAELHFGALIDHISWGLGAVR